LALIVAAKAYFLSRIQHVMIVWIDNNRVGDVVSWLNGQSELLIDRWVEVGVTHRLRCRLIAWRVPVEQANRRRQRAHKAASKAGRQASAASLRACDWTFLITNVPIEQLSLKEVIILYRSRWQIELLFKRWKSVGLIAVLSGKNDIEVMVRLWAKLTAALIQDWLIVMVAWNATTSYSFERIAKQVNQIANELMDALATSTDMRSLLERFTRTIKATCKRDIRSKSGTLELLRDPEKLEYSLS
jgi:IS4 transposase